MNKTTQQRPGTSSTQPATVCYAAQRPFAVQTKLTVGAANDRYEQEADRVADQVMRMPLENASTLSVPVKIQRLCTECGDELQRQVEEEEEEELLQAKAERDGIADVSPDVAAQVRGLHGAGQPLPEMTRAFFEPCFGFDLSRVRIHADSRAATTARALKARAYTMGNNIAFAAGHYAPDSHTGRRLLAHELTHVVQQNFGGRSTPVVQRQRGRRPVAVTLATRGHCLNPRAIAQAIPGARAMANMALNWFLTFGVRNRARIDRYLQANFLSTSDDVFDAVKERVIRIRDLLDAAQSGQLTFDCAPANDPDCGGRPGFVRVGERNTVHICQPFFRLTLEGRRWMLIHECAHLAGAIAQPEHYYGFFGPVGSSACTQATPAASTRDALAMADSYARLIWCLTRQPGITVTPP